MRPTVLQPCFRVVLVHRDQPTALARTVGHFRADPAVERIVVVDNGSSPDALARLADLAGRVTGVEVVATGRNLGFGPGANVGLRRWLEDGAAPEWVLVAPHDVEPAPDCVSRLAGALAAEPLAGLACADVGDGSTPMLDPYFGGVTRPAVRDEGWEPADYPHGTLMALRRSCVAEVGVFDERYFAYCEEAELGRRARLAGWSVGLVRGARVTNTDLGSSVAVVDYLQQRNTLLLVREMSGWYHAGIRIGLTALSTAVGLRHPDRRPPVFDPRARWMGVRDFLAGRTGPPPAEVAAPDRAGAGR